MRCCGGRKMLVTGQIMRRQVTGLRQCFHHRSTDTGSAGQFGRSHSAALGQCVKYALASARHARRRISRFKDGQRFGRGESVGHAHDLAQDRARRGHDIIGHPIDKLAQFFGQWRHLAGFDYRFDFMFRCGPFGVPPHHAIDMARPQRHAHNRARHHRHMRRHSVIIRAGQGQRNQYGHIGHGATFGHVHDKFKTQLAALASALAPG